MYSLTILYTHIITKPALWSKAWSLHRDIHDKLSWHRSIHCIECAACLLAACLQKHSCQGVERRRGAKRAVMHCLRAALSHSSYA